MLPPRARPIALVALLALPLLPAAAASSTTCQSTPIGLVCLFDEGTDGIPERAHVVDPNGRNAVILDAWHRPGFDSFRAGSREPIPYMGSAYAVVAVSGTDRDVDAARERADIRVDAFAPSNIGAYVIVTAHDANSDGTPERVDLFLFSPQHGVYAAPMRTGLP